MRKAPSALVVGAISRDFEAGSRDPEGRPGGTVHYAGAALVRLGAKTRVLTSVCAKDADTLLAPLRRAHVEIQAREGRGTTTYENDYSAEVDLHRLVSVSDTILPEDVPASWRDSDLVQLGPLHVRDIHPELPALFRGLVGLDVQGLLRSPAETGPTPYPTPGAEPFLGRVPVVHVSESELSALLGEETLEAFSRKHGVEELLVTRGARGVTLLVGGRRSEVPARPVEAARSVGAGDVFLGTYLLWRARGAGPVEAALAAADVAAEQVRAGEIRAGYRPRGEAT